MRAQHPYAEFYAKTFYEKFGVPIGTKTLDMWYDKLLYGRVDETQDSVYMTGDKLENKIKQLDVSVSPPVFVLNFVSDAFRDLNNFIARANATGKIPSNSLYANLRPQRGHVHFDKIWSVHLENFYGVFLSYLQRKDNKNKIKDFKDFLNFFIKFIQDFDDLIPITKTSFIKSQFCNPFISGLVLDLITLDHDDDEARDACLEDRGFEVFQAAARKHGFFIAKHAPWRLIADITSFAMQNYMSPAEEMTWSESKGGSIAYADHNLGILDTPNYGLTHRPGTASNLFSGDRYFQKSYLGDIPDLQQNLHGMYSVFITQYPYQINTGVCKAAKKAISGANSLGPAKGTNYYSKDFVTREPVSLSEVAATKSSYGWLALYKTILLHENKIPLNARRKKNLDRSCRTYYNIHGYNKTLKYINDYVKKAKGQLAMPDYCQSYAFCHADQKIAKQLTPKHVTIIQDTTTSGPSATTAPTGGGSTSGGSY